MKLGIHLNDRMALTDVLRFSIMAEKKGFHSAWFAEARWARDALIPMGLALKETKKMMVGTAIVSDWTRNVALLASSLNTLNEIAPGRVLLGIGGGDSSLLKMMGIQKTAPLAHLREYVLALKRLLSGDVVNLEGEFIKVNGISIGSARNLPQIPIYIGGTGEKTIGLAGAIANGVVLDYLISPESTEKYISIFREGARAAGRDPAELHVAQLVLVSADEDLDKAYQVSKSHFLKYFDSIYDLLRNNSRFKADAEEIMKMAKANKEPTEIIKIIPDDLVDQLTATGDMARCRSKIKNYMKTGVDIPIIYVISGKVNKAIDGLSPLTWPKA
ncbi:MAG: LLM class flavin-dependent oxidoreductase [Nitrososphaerota archaeon]|nr:LLM class flavin-dependent oxidoreductase [Nitrososphaerota archaeon]